MIRTALRPALALACVASLVLSAHAATITPSSSISEPSPQSDARFGSAMATGDVNGDGIDDLIVGSTGSGSGQVLHAGEVNVFLGPSFAHMTALYSPSGYPRFGEAVATGDINGDGFDEVIVSSRYAHVGDQMNAGEVFVFFGPALSTWQTLYDPIPQASAAFGISMAAGDTNNDGFDEVVVGAWDSNYGNYTKAGETFVFAAPSLASVTTLRSPFPQDVADFGVATAVGDFTGDGNGDVIVGSWIADVGGTADAGSVFVFAGPSYSSVTALTDAQGGGRRLGQSVTAGDVDGDGDDEVVAGATGVALVFDDAGGGQYNTTRIALPSNWGSLAITGVAARDVDGDGDDDVVIGAPERNYGGGSGIGSALLSLSGSAAPLSVLQLASPVGGAAFGWRVGIVDGFALAAAPGHAVGATGGAGRIFLLPIIDTDADGWLNADDNCSDDANPTQGNNDRDFVDLSPPKAFDDLTWPISDAAGDACDPDDDNDGIDDAREAALPDAQCPTASGPTGPFARDTDGDLTVDSAECLLGTDPASAASFPPAAPSGDSDRDGLPDAVETAIGSNAALADTDADGISDGVEVRGYGSNPTAVDTDADGCPDGREIASINGDRAVTSIDLSQVAQAFGAMGEPSYFAHFDINRDRKISSIDLSIVAKRFGSC